MIPLRDNVPTRSFPVVTVGLIAANLAVWLWELQAEQRRILADSFYPCSVDSSCTTHHLPFAESTFTSMFMHAGWLHVLGNVLFLWIFGNNMEDAMGRLRFLVFYLLGGIAATALQAGVTLHFDHAHAEVPNLGASGAISAVLGAYFLLLPRARVLTVIFVVLIFLREIPAYLFLGVWIVFQALEGGLAITHPQAGGGTAFFAHVGGFAFGLLAVHAFIVRRPLRPTY